MSTGHTYWVYILASEIGGTREAPEKVEARVEDCSGRKAESELDRSFSCDYRSIDNASKRNDFACSTHGVVARLDRAIQ